VENTLKTDIFISDSSTYKHVFESIKKGVV